MAGNGKPKEARAEFGLGSAASHGWLTYRAVDVVVTVALYGLILCLPAIVRVMRWMRGGKPAVAVGEASARSEPRLAA